MIDTGAFIAGVGVLVTLDLAVLGVSIQNARRVGTDEQARKKAKMALKKAREARQAAREARRTEWVEGEKE